MPDEAGGVGNFPYAAFFPVVKRPLLSSDPRQMITVPFDSTLDPATRPSREWSMSRQHREQRRCTGTRDRCVGVDAGTLALRYSTRAASGERAGGHGNGRHVPLDSCLQQTGRCALPGNPRVQAPQPPASRCRLRTPTRRSLEAHPHTVSQAGSPARTATRRRVQRWSGVRFPARTPPAAAAPASVVDPFEDDPIWAALNTVAELDCMCVQKRRHIPVKRNDGGMRIHVRVPFGHQAGVTEEVLQPGLYGPFSGLQRQRDVPGSAIRTRCKPR